MRSVATLLPVWFTSIAVLAGCQGGGPRGVDVAIDRYEAGGLTAAYEMSVAELRGARRFEAAYVAGLAAYQLGRKSDAEMRFQVASASEDAAIAARATAMLGVIQLQRGQFTEAKGNLEAAASKLHGSDQAAARRLAGMARRQERPSEPGHVLDPLARGAAGSPLSSDGRFALQVGAFRDQRRARRAADAVRPIAEEHGVKPIRIVPTLDDRGRPFYLVQCGSFTTRQQAARVRTVLGRPELIVATQATQ